MEHDTNTKEEPKKGEAYLYKSQPTSWGALISLVLVIVIIVVGAFYAWGKRIEQDRTGSQNLPSFNVETSGGVQ